MNANTRKSIPPALRSDRIIAAFKQLLGDSQPTAIAITLALATTLGWFGSASYELVLRLFDSQHQLPGSPAAMLAALAAFPVLAGLLLHLARSRARLVPLGIEQRGAPPARALIMFLSPPGAAAATLWETRLNTPELGDITCAETRATLCAEPLGKTNWRMPIEAIAYHLGAGTLERIVLIPSHESAASALLFADLVARLSCQRVGVTAIDGDALRPIIGDALTGFDYEDAVGLKGAVEAAFSALAAAGLPDSDILIDITAGQKVAGVVAAAVALAEGRRFQYVSTRDYQVRSYDITYQP